MPTAEARVRELNRGYGAAEAHLPRSGWSPQDRTPEPSYYDLSMLKPPVWKWEIVGYFFFGGLSAGAYLLARLAERFGGRRTDDVRTAGTAIAVLTTVPCAPLLIKDLGDISRFHHMLRVCKPQSPMSLGTWVLTAYSSIAALALVRELLESDTLDLPAKKQLAALLKRGNPVILAAIDGAGIPLALMMISYTGVLISCTATPVWSRNAWLAPLFAASGMSTGAASIQLALACLDGDHTSSRSHRALEHIETAARVAEAGTLAGYLTSAGELAGPLTRGKLSPHLLIAAGALVIPELIQALPGKPSRWKTMLAAGITLAGALSLRWGIIYAGHESANDPAAARQVSRRRESEA